MTSNFILHDTQIVKLNAWIEHQNALAIESQKLNPPDVPPDLLESFWKAGFPYGGAVGGDLTYEFTPTSLGVTAIVRNVHTGNTIDLTDYESW